MWWTAKLLPDEVGVESHPDYMVKPPSLSRGAELAIGAGAVVLAALGTGVLVLTVRRGALRRGWVGFIAPWAAMSAYAGVAYSVMTRPVSGANIGGGLALLAAAPVGLVMVTFSIISARRLLLTRCQ
jgi:hypothetical protein